MTEPSLHDDIAGLASEIHDLSDKFSAKEVLAQKAAELAEKARKVTRNNRILIILFGIVLLVVMGVVFKIFQLADQNSEIASCQAQFNKATELRSTLLTRYTVRQQHAMKGLVEARGLPNSPTIIEARDDWLEADWLLSEARRLNPVIQYEDYCKPVDGVDSPKVPPAEVPDRSSYPGPRSQVR